MFMKIWVLFSVMNEYDQLDNNMEGWWIHKPSIEALVNYMRINIAIVRGIIEDGNRYNNKDYRLEQIEEGMLK